MMLRAECTLISCIALLTPQLFVHLPLRAYIEYGLWPVLVQLAGILVLVQPLVFCELALGQRSQFGPVKCWCFGPAWKGIGLLMLTCSALDLLATNADVLDHLQRHHNIGGLQYTAYFQLALWLGVLLPVLTWWPKYASKLWVLGSLLCIGALCAVAARTLSLGHSEAALQRLWQLSAKLPDSLLDLLRASLLPYLYACGTGALIALGSYRKPRTNAFLDSGLTVGLVFLLHALYTVSTSALVMQFCQGHPALFGDAASPASAIDASGAAPAPASSSNGTCQMPRYNVRLPTVPSASANQPGWAIAPPEADDRAGDDVRVYLELLEGLPTNMISPKIWLWFWRSALGWLFLTRMLVRADAWVRAVSDKFRGCQSLRRRQWTARLLASLIVCTFGAGLGFVQQHFKQNLSLPDLYRMSTVRWLPLLLTALACLAVAHGYGGVRFIKEVGGGVALRPWFLVLVGFVTPGLAIALAGLRMHVSIQALLWPSAGNLFYRIIGPSIQVPNYANLLLAVAAFLFLLAGLFSPLIWHGLCRRQRCIDLVQPTKSWQGEQLHRPGGPGDGIDGSTGDMASEDSANGTNGGGGVMGGMIGSGSGGGGGYGGGGGMGGGDFLVRDLGATTIGNESPVMTHTMRQQHQQQQQYQAATAVKLANPMLPPPSNDIEPPLPPPPPPAAAALMYTNAKPTQPVRPMVEQQQQQQYAMTAVVSSTASSMSSTPPPPLRRQFCRCQQ
ncbi:hypothetical protein BOX15_Mlig000173g1 [Macrostomum lignano]|uniref:Uncharacterized protein n=1 Tax=Macrostomum lignano TaxID=282301 RepID=A0A267FUB6_9PLAT|nr:hypothetical protein BOX15_Mlig000173g1 [Macrostomum lignano]